MFQWDKSCSYDERQKRHFHTTARSRLKKLAAELKLPPGSYDLRSNKAGMAVSGEVSLHHECAYIQVGQFGLSSGHGILIRSCKGRNDCAGGPNHFVALTMLDDIPVLAAAVRAITGVGRQDRPNPAPPNPAPLDEPQCPLQPPTSSSTACRPAGAIPPAQKACPKDSGMSDHPTGETLPHLTMTWSTIR